MAESGVTAPAPSPSPAPAAPASSAPVAPRAVESYSPAEHKVWRETGQRPEDAAASPPPQAPASPAPADDLPSTDGGHRFVTTPPPPGVSRRQHERNELIRAATERDQRIRDLEVQLAQRDQPAPTRPAAPPYDGTDPADPMPKLADFTIDRFAEAEDPYAERAAAYAAAKARWEGRKDQRVAQSTQGAIAAAKVAQDRAKSFSDRCLAHATHDPAFDAKFRSLAPQIRPDSVLGVSLAESEVGPPLMAHLADHPDEFQALITSPDLPTFYRSFGRLEARFASASPAATVAASAGVPDAPEPVAPKLVSDAPAPGTTLGSRPAETDDPEIAALKRGDFTGYRRAKQQARAARLAGR